MHGEHEGIATGERVQHQTVDVKDYFAMKYKLKKNIDKYYKQQVDQYHHDKIAMKSARQQNMIAELETINIETQNNHMLMEDS